MTERQKPHFNPAEDNVYRWLGRLPLPQGDYVLGGHTLNAGVVKRAILDLTRQARGDYVPYSKIANYLLPNAPDHICQQLLRVIDDATCSLGRSPELKDLKLQVTRLLPKFGEPTVRLDGYNDAFSYVPQEPRSNR